MPKKKQIKPVKGINLVEMLADSGEQSQAPCKFGNIVEGHACYCHNDESPYRKCPIWRNDDEWNKDNCPLFTPLTPKRTKNK